MLTDSTDFPVTSVGFDEYSASGATIARAQRPKELTPTFGPTAASITQRSVDAASRRGENKRQRVRWGRHSCLP